MVMNSVRPQYILDALFSLLLFQSVFLISKDIPGWTDDGLIGTLLYLGKPCLRALRHILKSGGGGGGRIFSVEPLRCFTKQTGLSLGGCLLNECVSMS